MLSNDQDSDGKNRIDSIEESFHAEKERSNQTSSTSNLVSKAGHTMKK